MSSLLSMILGKGHADENEVNFWKAPERAGWLMKQGITPRGVIPVGTCLTIKGAEDVINRPFAFELSTHNDTFYFIADNDKEKEDWINSVGRSIVRNSKSVTEEEVLDYDSTAKN